jgi:alkanesulfonate monooxygenase SsuD/methylene tetrahydromethanopterin reductase-like flavin-dependent oxidoreductase (luciferase family)
VALRHGALVPTLAHEYEQVIKRYFDGRGALVGPELKTGTPVPIDRPPNLLYASASAASPRRAACPSSTGAACSALSRRSRQVIPSRTRAGMPIATAVPISTA